MIQQPIGILGGTFDPIHLGHVQAALTVKQEFALKEVRLIPAGMTVHRQQPQASAHHRLMMVKLAIKNYPELHVDDREIIRAMPSYTIDTLRSLKRELGNTQPLNLILGLDAFLTFPSWYQWPEILQLSNLIVIQRPNYCWPTTGQMTAILAEHLVPDKVALATRSASGIIFYPYTNWQVSASLVRHNIFNHKPWKKLVAAEVASYVVEQKLYKMNINK